MRAKARPRAPLRHCSQRRRSGVSPDSGQEETGSDRAATMLQTNVCPYCPPAPGRRSKNPPENPQWAGPQSQPEALGQVLGAVLCLRSKADPLSLGRPCQGRAPANSPTPSRARTKPPNFQRPARPLAALTRKVPDTPSPDGMRAMERRTHRPGPASHQPTGSHGTRPSARLNSAIRATVGDATYLELFV
jgi:hypothetical protein